MPAARPTLRRLLTALVVVLAASGVSVAAVSFLAACKSAGHH